MKLTAFSQQVSEHVIYRYIDIDIDIDMYIEIEIEIDSGEGHEAHGVQSAGKRARYI